MLYLEPPFHIIHGISIFCDHADPLQYYYLPVYPHLTLERDPRTNQRIPHLQVIKYAGSKAENSTNAEDEITGGFLSFDVNLGVEPEVLEDLKAQIKQADRKRLADRNASNGAIRLTPVPVVDGSVKMMLFGTQSGEVPTEETPQPKFVLKISHHAKPALYGDNQAAFSVQLDRYGATILEQAMQGEMSPIGIVYGLDFLALRPAYNVRLSVDWERIQKHFDERFSGTFLIASVDIDKAIDELREQRAIVIEADTFVPEDDSSGGVLGRRDQALEEVRDMITNAFFEPSLQPMKSDDGWDKALDVAARVTALPAAGLRKEIFGFGYKRTDYQRIDKKTLNANFSERTTVKRTIHPQGHLMGIFRVLQQEGLDPEKFILNVKLDDDFFKRRKFEVGTVASFQEDSIASINVKVRYGNEVKSVLLDTPTAKKTLVWPSLLVNRVMQKEVSYSYTVNFKEVDSAERPITLTSPEFKTSADALQLQTRGPYSIKSIPIIATDFPDWTAYPLITVQVKYTDEANKIRLNESFRLDKAHKELAWKLFTMDAQKNHFQYRLSYFGANNRNIVLPWVETDEEQIIISAPFSDEDLQVQIAPAVNWSLMDRVFVDVSYADKANRVQANQSFEFTENQKETKVFKVRLTNPELRLVGYSVTALKKNGDTIETPRSFTREPRIIVTGRQQGHRIVLVRPPLAAEFASKKIKTLKVELRYLDEPNGFQAEDSFEFSPTELRPQFFEFDYVGKPAYEYRTITRLQSGLAKTSNWQKANFDDLAVALG